MFLLYVNQIDFFDLPYKFDLTQESDSGVKYQAEVIFEDKDIPLPEPWNNREFYKNFQEAFGGSEQQFSKALVKIEESNSSALINEIYDSMVEYSSEEIGLVELKLNQLPPQTKLDLKFDTDILQRLVMRTLNLQTFEV